MRTTRINFGLSLVSLLFSLPAVAQTTSTIEGSVKDPQGAVVAGAQLTARSSALATERNTTSDQNGFYRITALPPGTYTVSVSQTGFAARNFENLELTLNRTVTLDIQLEVGAVVQGNVQVTAAAELIDPTASSTGGTITAQQIGDLPVNGREYLDLMQLVPGVTINRQVNPGSDNSTPVLGERSGNNNFLIDGQPNKDTVNGGPAAQFNQETIAEFQVLTTGYKAEFGQASGAIVNVITKSGGNGFHGVGSLFHRNDAFDSSNALGQTQTEAPPLRKLGYSLALGGPVIKNKVFFFGSAARVTEKRVLGFTFPDTGSAVVNQLLRDQETRFDNPSRIFETRTFLKLDEQLGRHHLTQQVNYTNRVVREFLPLSATGSLPSTRNDSGARHLLLGFADTILLGAQSNPWIVTLRGGYRGEPTDTRPSHPEAGSATIFIPFANVFTGSPTGDFPLVRFGNPNSPSNLDQKYTSFGASVGKLFGDHNLKFGWNFLRTKVDGVETQIVSAQLFATVGDFATYGPVNAGFFTPTTIGGLTPEANEIHLLNNYHGLFLQNDWKFRSNLTLNLGLRWDYDSEFVAKDNVSPRVGFAWGVTPKTVVRGHFGVFYDQFRLGLARDVPAFGGADRRAFQPFSYPRGFYGVPTTIVASTNAALFPPTGLCVSPNLTDAQIAASGAPCPVAASNPYIGRDRLNRVVAPGHALIPADAVINASNIQALSGLTPDQYAAQASAAVGKPAGFFFFAPSGALTHAAIPPRIFPTSIDASFKTPHTLSLSIGVQREITRDTVVEVDYYHRVIRNLLGVRQTNLAFQSRVVGRTFLPPFTAGELATFGPWYEGVYDALIINFNKRLSRRFLLGGNYTYAQATDNQLGIQALPSDSFVGIATVVTEAGTGRTNLNGPFTRTSGRFVAQAGTFVNGPDRDKGPSDLALDHVFQIHGLVIFPWQIQVSSIFRAQSGFHFSRTSPAGVDADPDGNGTLNTIDLAAGRNSFTAPPFVNLDMRFAKRFDISERVKVQVLFEFFNLLNRQNPAAVNNVNGSPAFNTRLQVLPGREGQIGFRVEF